MHRRGGQNINVLRWVPQTEHGRYKTEKELLRNNFLALRRLEMTCKQLHVPSRSFAHRPVYAQFAQLQAFIHLGGGPRWKSDLVCRMPEVMPAVKWEGFTIFWYESDEEDELLEHGVGRRGKDDPLKRRFKLGSWIHLPKATASS